MAATLAELLVEVAGKTVVAGYVDEEFDLPVALGWIHAMIGGPVLDAWRSGETLRICWGPKLDRSHHTGGAGDQDYENPNLDGSFRNLSLVGTMPVVKEFHGFSLDLVRGVLRLSGVPPDGDWLLQDGQAFSFLKLLVENARHPVPKHIAAERVLPALTASLGFKATAWNHVNSSMAQYVKIIRGLQDGSGTRPLDENLKTLRANKRRKRQPAYCLVGDVGSHTMDRVERDVPHSPLVVEPYYAGWLDMTPPELGLTLDLPVSFVQTPTKPRPIDARYAEEDGRIRQCRFEWQNHADFTRLLTRLPDDENVPLRFYPPRDAWHHEMGTVVLREVIAFFHAAAADGASLKGSTVVTLGFDAGSDADFGTLRDLLLHGGRVEWHRGDTIYLLAAPPEPHGEPPLDRMQFSFFSSLIPYGRLYRTRRILRLSWAPQGAPFARYLPSASDSYS